MSGYELHNAVTMEAVTDGSRFHFFGYYDKTPWSLDSTRILALETEFMDRRPGPGDTATVGIVDRTQENQFTPVATTNAWNWQQGCMLQWVPGSETQFVYNVATDTGFAAEIRSLDDSTPRRLPLPIYGLSPTGLAAASLNFARMYSIRAGYGYAGHTDPWTDELTPERDGLWWMDLETGEYRLIFSVADARRLGRELPGMGTGKHRFEHAQWNTDGTRIALLHRWVTDPAENPLRAQWLTRLLTVAPDGSDPHVVSDHGYFSHYDWRDPATLLGWAYREGIGNRYFCFQDADDPAPTILGDGLYNEDGHCSFSPDRNWLLTDTYPGPDGFRTLMLHDLRADRRIDIGRFHGPRPADGEIRCDLHPRWSRDGDAICIDSLHDEGRRQMYVLDVSRIVAGSEG